MTSSELPSMQAEMSIVVVFVNVWARITTDAAHRKNASVIILNIGILMPQA
jgi:hypothetical protein